MYKLKLGFRSLFYRHKQYTSLFLVSMVGIGISLFTLFTVRGMIAALESKAEIFYGGDLNLIGALDYLSMDDSSKIISKVENLFPNGTIIVPRLNLDGGSFSLYYEGVNVLQRVVMGVDFEKEKELFQKVSYVRGNAQNMAKSDGILLSSNIANQLDIQIGDYLTLQTKNTDGYINTVPLEVHGIFQDSSVFGMYTSYVDINLLRETCGYESDWANRIAIDLPQNEKKSLNIKNLQSELEKKLPMYPLVKDKQIFYEDLGSFEETTFALITLYANLDDLRILLEAIKLVTNFIVIMLSIIIIVGISSTYRVIVMKRINEIGIYKAIGMNKKSIYQVFLIETSFVLIFGSILGFIFSLLLSVIPQFVNLSFIPAFDIFLMNGCIVPEISLLEVFTLCIMIYVTTILAVLFSVRKSIRVTPVEALGVTE